MAEGEATPRGRLNHRSDARSSLLPPNYTISETRQQGSEREQRKIEGEWEGQPVAEKKEAKNITGISYLVTDDERRRRDGEETVAELRQERSGQRWSEWTEIGAIATIIANGRNWQRDGDGSGPSLWLPLSNGYHRSIRGTTVRYSRENRAANIPRWLNPPLEQEGNKRRRARRTDRDRYCLL